MISKNNILDMKSRRDIYQFISKNPGLHITEVSLRLNIPRSTVRYHLRYLLKSNLINVKADKKDKRLYVCNQIGVKDKELLSILRQEVPFKIIMYLFLPGFCSKAELAKELNVHPSTILFHLKKLLDMDVIRPIEVIDGKFISYQEHKPIVFKRPVGREIFYMWKNFETAEDVYRLLISHKESMSDPKVVEAYYYFVREWERLFGRNKPKKRFGFNSGIDNIIKGVDEVFPFPYHL